MAGEPTTIPPTAVELERAFDSLSSDDGSWNLAAVLAVFAARHGDVPGITPAAPDLAAAVDDRYLADILAPRLDDLIPEQRAAVRAWLEPGPLVANRQFRFTADGVEEVTGAEMAPVELPRLVEPADVTTLPTIAPDPTVGVPRRPSQAPDLESYTTSVVGYLRSFERLSGVSLEGFEVSVGSPTPAARQRHGDSCRPELQGHRDHQPQQ